METSAKKGRRGRRIGLGKMAFGDDLIDRHTQHNTHSTTQDENTGAYGMTIEPD